ncbi:hypothetical protein Nepgr_001448 [Nepenthes gracilis]|uniref:Sec-independent protein translocase protein TATA, chloroplastic n=1 Tax=Nepenthes gracilis TaxID=150966 RepID=A0AAD3P4F7_NEPGR|nr:hypothetical protein Nepgr_001448 [Nepenthes gracilis]
MEISSATLSLPSFSKSHAFSSSNSSFLLNSNSKLFKTVNPKRLVLNRTRCANVPQKRLSCTCLFGLGVPELVVIVGVAALVFGPKKLPEVGRSIGKTVKSFQQAAKEFESELKKEPDSVADAADAKQAAVTEEKEDVEVSTYKETL